MYMYMRIKNAKKYTCFLDYYDHKSCISINSISEEELIEESIITCDVACHLVSNLLVGHL